MRHQYAFLLIALASLLAGNACDMGVPLDSSDADPASEIADLNIDAVDDPEAQRLLLEWQAAGAIPEADVNRDGVVNIMDLVLVARNFGLVVDLPEISIATFNIQVFGQSKRENIEVMDVLADVADAFDILAVQEIRDASGATPYVIVGGRSSRRSRNCRYSELCHTARVSHFPAEGGALRYLLPGKSRFSPLAGMQGRAPVAAHRSRAADCLP